MGRDVSQVLGARRGWVKRALLFTCALAVFVPAAMEAYYAAPIYRSFRAMTQALPDLPAIQSGPPRHPAEFVDKVWVHRVNSVERAVLVAKQYRGLEIDVAYDLRQRYFDVGHSPEPSAGISLEQIFAALPDVGSHYFWLDVKNLSGENASSSCSDLQALARKYDVERRIIVESPNPQALSCFSDAGFYTSYYLFAESDPSEAYLTSRETFASAYDEVRANLTSAHVDAVSADYRYLPFIEKYVLDKDVLLWYLAEDRPVISFAFRTFLQAKERVKVVLVPQYGPGLSVRSGARHEGDSAGDQARRTRASGVGEMMPSWWDLVTAIPASRGWTRSGPSRSGGGGVWSRVPRGIRRALTYS